MTCGNCINKMNCVDREDIVTCRLLYQSDITPHDIEGDLCESMYDAGEVLIQVIGIDINAVGCDKYVKSSDE